MRQSEKSTSPAEKLLGFSKNLDKVMILGGAAVSLVNPLVGGAIIGGSLATIEGAKRVELGMNSRRSRQLGSRAVRMANR